ncbi:MAG TPA: 2-C-methyl-D-erythritol 4-phosphate cytidylyltransferase [Xanthomonadales bacterium]|nr:2-C-methyl-D-erythritol 4-phosphate cytidylyltransferase [Xanthomonadales bacterium]
MKSKVSIHALIPAAGLSERFGAELPKQYSSLLGQSVLAHSIEALSHHPSIRNVTVILAEDDARFDSLVRPLFPDVSTVTGGASRAHSVLNGLRHIQAQDNSADYALVHDAARPCIGQSQLDDLIIAGLACDDGAILAIPVSDTIKKADQDNLIEQTVDRNHLWQAQTPQMFPVQRLLDALEASLDGLEPPTDESSAMEMQGARPQLVMGSSSNIKITTAQDLIIAEGIISRGTGTANQS